MIVIFKTETAPLVGRAVNGIVFSCCRSDDREQGIDGELQDVTGDVFEFCF